jgi:hypothetical protein
MVQEANTSNTIRLEMVFIHGTSTRAASGGV